MIIRHVTSGKEYELTKCSRPKMKSHRGRTWGYVPYFKIDGKPVDAYIDTTWGERVYIFTRDGRECYCFPVQAVGLVDRVDQNFEVLKRETRLRAGDKARIIHGIRQYEDTGTCNKYLSRRTTKVTGIRVFFETQEVSADVTLANEEGSEKDLVGASIRSPRLD